MLTDRKGFTLVEMAIVLIIIGIIIGAVVKGKDLVRSAEQKKVYTKFVNAWRLAYLNFYDRTGKVLGDFHDGTAGGQNGQADTNLDGAGVVADADWNALLTNGALTTHYGLEDVGLEAPVTNTGTAYTYRYLDSEGGGHTLYVTFLFDPAATGNYNYLELTNIPAELALALDTMIDGEADGLSGDFIGDATAGATWSTAATPQTEISARWKMQF